MSTNDDALRAEGDVVVRGNLCRNIRCKGMYVTGEMFADPNMLPYDATVWWCTLTQKPVGPDFQPCSAAECLAGRKCFVAPDPS